MPAGKYSLTFDFGSGSVKAALVDGSHAIVSSCNKAYPIFYPKTGWAVQEPENIWTAMQQATNETMSAVSAMPDEIKGIAVSHTGSSIIFVDERGRHLSDCVMWMDGRGAEQAAYLNALLGKEIFTGKNVIAKLRWFVQNEPKLVDEAHKLLDMGGYLLNRLTGNMVYEFTSARTTRLFDVYRKEWDERMIEACGLPKRLIPQRVVLSNEHVGGLTQEAANALGIAPGTPVFGGCCDHATAVLGAGCVRPGDAHIYIGTSAWLCVTAKEYTDVATIRPSPVAGQWYHFLENDSGGSCIDYLIQRYYQKELLDGDDVYEIVNRESRQAGTQKEVLFLPYLTGASAPISDVNARAALLNIEAGTTRGQIAKAVLEGIGFNLRWLKEFYERQEGWNINFLRGLGGGMLLEEGIQSIADILGETITTVNDPRFAGNIGLAVCVETGLHERGQGYMSLKETVQCGRTFCPRAELRERYERLYAIFKDAFYSLQSIYGELNAGGKKV